MHPSQSEITQSQQLIIDVFRAFREELMKAYGMIEHDSKSDESPVTQLDIKIETELKEELRSKFPRFGFKGEETESFEGEYDAVWHVDPIDSTNSFIHGLPYCANMAGLTVGDTTVAAVIYDFATDELFTARKDEGAYKNGQRITIKALPLGSSIIFGDSYSYTHFYEYLAPHRAQLFAPVGATGYFLTRIAQGSIQGTCYFKAKIKPHDIIPGILIVREAGGHVASLDGNDFTNNTTQFVAGTKDVCDLLAGHVVA